MTVEIAKRRKQERNKEIRGGGLGFGLGEKNRKLMVEIRKTEGEALG